MINAQRNTPLFQQEWTGKGERGIRDFLLIPAVFFGAVSPGLYLSSLLTGYRAGCWISLVMNFFGYGITHLLFLGRMERFWRALMNWKTSWISRGFLFNAFFTGFGILYSVASSGTGRNIGAASITDGLAVLSAVSALLFAAYPGFMLSTVKAIPFWRSALEPVIFFLQGLLGGTAIQICLASVVPLEASIAAALVKLNYALALAVLLLILAALAFKAHHGGIERQSVASLTIGHFSAVFLIGALGLGLLAPVLLLTVGLIVPLDIGTHAFLYYGVMVLELGGIYTAKYGILRAGAYSPIRP